MHQPQIPSQGPDRRDENPTSGQPAGFGVVDRRVWPVDRRRLNPDGSAGDTASTGLERRRGPGRRLSDFTRAAEEGQLTKEQFLFLMAIEQFKKANAKTFPTWTDVLEVVRLLGYRKTCASELTIGAAEDWRETAEAPHGVRAARWAQRRAIDEKRRADRAA
ncbi:MAG: hypothetical protein DYG92_02715 [Leptolyngbya sp. PLA1]|nr:hypothetical protein [Leptolyngbya sp. PLA1]